MKDRTLTDDRQSRRSNDFNIDRDMAGLTEVLRSGAQRLLVQAVETEAEAFLAMMSNWKLADGRARFVRHGQGHCRFKTLQVANGDLTK